MLAIAYMHPSVLDTTHLASLTDSELKSKVFDKINEIVFNKVLETYNKSVLLERLSIMIKKLSDSDRTVFKRNILDLTSSETEDFQELYSDMVDLEIKPVELRTDTLGQSTESQKVGYCKEINDQLLSDLRENKPISLTEQDAYKHMMCKKDNYDKTVEALQHLPELTERIKKDIKKELVNVNVNDSEIDKMTTEKAEMLQQDIEEQLRLVRESNGN